MSDFAFDFCIFSELGHSQMDDRGSAAVAWAGLPAIACTRSPQACLRASGLATFIRLPAAKARSWSKAAPN